MKKALARYLKNRQVGIEKLLLQPMDTFTQEGFHQLRIEIKKLNALLSLVKYCSPKFRRKKTFQPYEKLFQQAGKIRETQLEKNLLQKQFGQYSLVQYHNHLQQQEEMEREHFFALTGKKPLQKLRKKQEVVAAHLNEVTVKKARMYLEKKYQGITKLLHKSRLQPEDFHEYRKRLKLLNYTLRILSTSHRLPDSGKDTLSTLLGNWHDSQVVLKHLEDTMENHKTAAKEKRQLQQIRTQLAADGRQKLKEINQILRKTN